MDHIPEGDANSPEDDTSFYLDRDVSSWAKQNRPYKIVRDEEVGR